MKLGILKLLRRIFKPLHVYHVVYTFNGGGGTMTLYRERPIETLNDLKAVREFVSDQTNISVAISSWIKLKPTFEDYEYFEMHKTETKRKGMRI